MEVVKTASARGKMFHVIGEILKILEKERQISIADICFRFKISKPTAYNYVSVLTDRYPQAQLRGGILFLTKPISRDRVREEAEKAAAEVKLSDKEFEEALEEYPGTFGAITKQFASYWARELNVPLRTIVERALEKGLSVEKDLLEEVRKK